MILLSLLKYFGPFLSPGKYPDSKQPLGVVMLIPAKTPQHATYWGGGNYLIPALKTRIQLQPVLSPTVLLICPLPVSVSPQTSSCNAANMLFTKWLREMIPAGAHLIPQLLPWNKDQERGEKVTPKEKAVGLKSPVEMKQSFSVCD